MTQADLDAIERVLSFWFAPGAADLWFEKNEAFDRRVRDALAEDHARAAAGAYDAWSACARGALALVILLDQVSRNLFRDDPRAFDMDARARAITRHAIDRGFDRQIASQSERRFFYLPLEHSENLDDQETCCRLMASLDEDPDWLDWSEKHRVVIARFGRFPHRNAALGRVSTLEELAFVAEAGSSF